MGSFPLLVHLLLLVGFGFVVVVESLLGSLGGVLLLMVVVVVGLELVVVVVLRMMLQLLLLFWKKIVVVVVVVMIEMVVAHPGFRCRSVSGCWQWWSRMMAQPVAVTLMGCHYSLCSELLPTLSQCNRQKYTT